MTTSKISAHSWSKKLAAVRCYTSQLTELHYDRAIEGLNRYRGEMAARRPYAEVFATWELCE